MAAQLRKVSLPLYVLMSILEIWSSDCIVCADDTNTAEGSKSSIQRGIRGAWLWEPPSNSPGSTNGDFGQGSGSGQGSDSSFGGSMPVVLPPLGFPPGFAIPGFGNAGGGIPGFGIPQFGMPAFGNGGGEGYGQGGGSGGSGGGGSGGGGGGGGGGGNCRKKDKECGGSGFGFGWGSGGAPPPPPPPPPPPYYCLPLNCNAGICSYMGFNLNNWPMNDGNRKGSERREDKPNGGGNAPIEGTNGKKGQYDDNHY